MGNSRNAGLGCAIPVPLLRDLGSAIPFAPAGLGLRHSLCPGGIWAPPFPLPLAGFGLRHSLPACRGGAFKKTGCAGAPRFLYPSGPFCKRACVGPVRIQKTDDLHHPSVFLSGKRDSNPRPSAWEADALPTELFPQLWMQM